MKKALLYGITASFFFAFTFILNRSMNLSGGYWLWGACLRYIFMLPMLVLALLPAGGWKRTMTEIGRDPGAWILWSTVGFGLFYAPLCLASVYGESWFTASCWQLTIVAGILLTPLFGKPVPVKNLLLSSLILAGIFLLMYHPGEMEGRQMISALAPLLIAAFSYPLGNRKMMQLCGNHLSTLERVFGMTLCSMPFWIAAAIYSCVRSGLPSGGQIAQSLLVALFSGVVATILFFKATDLVKHNHVQLALIEATQCGEVLFTLFGGILFLHDPLPSLLGVFGILLIVAGMVAGALLGQR